MLSRFCLNLTGKTLRITVLDNRMGGIYLPSVMSTFYLLALKTSNILVKNLYWIKCLNGICKEHILNVILQLYILNKGMDFKDGVVVDF